ncbi:hypothetical protein N7491_004381 [Penicillium cf. griseofulvum]|uniref:Scytalone dehydratase-like domain-containing protein n=1 Tax=Penicillium cf. griseofulvum TaxID=2972120 RepID=A0A9W9J1G7_9EURO|nr:hypothetical protein N7472_007071 [Penicillium cf. griseofulvum]KAJ5422997.1 hypothetical protein N7445_011105 [Penicillium cf. griseofulvum]KAJ5433786.1 hypothetical protein N7491_004381 [Penicillium cf. griseofulvum]
MGSASTEVSLSEYLVCSELTFEWADSYDTKNWDRLASILAPTVKINYASVNEFKDDKLPASEFVQMMSAPEFLGDPLIHTQHMMGAHKYRKIAPDLIEGYHQIRAAHQRYTGPDLQEIEAKGHGHAVITLTYVKVDGRWKWGGITTDIRWNEFEFDKIFKFRGRNVVP